MSFLLNRKLKRWVDASLITEETALKIQANEATGSGTNVMHAALGIGALTIVTGIISVIAANWELIPPYLKLVSNFTFLTAVAIALAWSIKNEKVLQREVLALVYFGGFLGSIALIGQVYHLNSHPVNALTFWLVLGSPVVFLSQSRYSTWAWTAAMITWAFQVHDWLPSSLQLNSPWGVIIALYVGMALHFARIRNPHFALSSLQASTLLLIGYIFFVGSMAWNYLDATKVNPIYTVVTVVLLLPFLAFVYRYYGRHLAMLFFAGLLYVLIPQSFLHGNLKEIGAILFIALCTAIAHYAVTIQHKKLFEVACLLIAFRIIMIYFEVFGSLLETGFGLIASGSFIIFIVWLWKSGRGRFWRKP